MCRRSEENRSSKKSSLLPSLFYPRGNAVVFPPFSLFFFFTIIVLSFFFSGSLPFFFFYAAQLWCVRFVLLFFSSKKRVTWAPLSVVDSYKCKEHLKKLKIRGEKRGLWKCKVSFFSRLLCYVQEVPEVQSFIVFSVFFCLEKKNKEAERWARCFFTV